MDNLNPHEAVRPNFNGDNHEQERQALVEKGLDPEQAVLTLELLWTLNNNREQEEWNRRRNAAAQAEAEAAREAAEIEERRRREDQENNAQARREDKKKHKAKYADIPDILIPADAIIFPSPYALKKLQKGDFVELYYFTNRGLEEAEKVGLEDESYVLIREGESQSWVPTSATRSGKDSVIKDEDLSWEEFLEAAPRMINFMMISEWPDGHIWMFVDFWAGLQKHEWRFSSDEFSKRALLVYQGQQRKRWHLTIGTGRGWSLAQISQDILTRTRDTLRTQAYNAELAKLSKATASLAGNHSSGTSLPPSGPRARQPSGYKRTAASDIEDHESAKKRRFRTDQSPLSVCAVCLSRKPHPTVSCEATITWDGRFDAFSKRVNKLIVARTSNKQICAKWQRDDCTLKHAALHICSGCSANSHGAQHCPRAQRTSDPDTIHC